MLHQLSHLPGVQGDAAEYRGTVPMAGCICGGLAASGRVWRSGSVVCAFQRRGGPVCLQAGGAGRSCAAWRAVWPAWPADLAASATTTARCHAVHAMLCVLACYAVQGRRCRPTSQGKAASRPCISRSVLAFVLRRLRRCPHVAWPGTGMLLLAAVLPLLFWRITAHPRQDDALVHCTWSQLCLATGHGLRGTAVPIRGMQHLVSWCSGQGQHW